MCLRGIFNYTIFMYISKVRRSGFLEGLFTRQERIALGFLLGMAFFGLGVMAWGRCLPCWLRGPLAGEAGAVATQVWVNRAGVEELVSLPGIGPVLARRIVEDRRRRGFYFTVADMGRVKGISPKTLKNLRGLLRFD